MSKRYRKDVGGASTHPDAELTVDSEPTEKLELREEELVARKELRDVGPVVVRTEVDTVPGRLEVDAYHEEVFVEHEPVGQVVSERHKPWEEDDAIVIPIYEEQLVVSKRLVLRERLRVRRVATTERQLFQDTLRRERLVVEDPSQTGLVREQYATADAEPPDDSRSGDPDESLLNTIVRKALE